MNKSSRRPRQNIDLVREPIRPALVRLAMPIMASAFLSTAYNLTDMAWVGTLGADAVAAVGVGGMYTWLSAGVITLARMGGQVLVGQELGAENRKKAASYARASVQLGLLLGILRGLGLGGLASAAAEAQAKSQSQDQTKQAFHGSLPFQKENTYIIALPMRRVNRRNCAYGSRRS